MSVLIIGSGGQAKVVIDALRCLSPDIEIAVRDRNSKRAGQIVAGIAIEVPELPDSLDGLDVHIAIGNAAARNRLCDAVRDDAGSLLTIIHPRAIVAKSASVGPGSFVAAGAILAPSAELGVAAIINHNSVIDHDCKVGDFSHIGPGATLGGAASIGRRCEIGAGANILPGICIGNDVTIGAGSVVTKAVADGETWVGVPAARLK